MTYSSKELKLHLSQEHKISPFSQYLKEIVYGGIDGIVTTFAVVAGFTGASSSGFLLEKGYVVVLLFGFANLFADATSMGLGNFLSVRTDQALNHSKNENPYLTALVTFTSFIFFGIIPLLPYIFLQNIQKVFVISVIFTEAALFLLGILRVRVTKEKPIKAMGEIVLLGSISAMVAYFVGTFFA